MNILATLAVASEQSSSGKLFEDVDNESGDGNQDGGGGDQEGRRLTDTGVLGLDLVGLYIDDIVLLEIIIRRGDDLGIVQVERKHLFTAFGILADEFYIVAHTVDGQIASLGQRLKDVDLLIADCEHTRMGHFA